MFLWMMDDETYRRRREAFVRADHSGYAPVTGQADPKAKEPASFDTKRHVDDGLVCYPIAAYDSDYNLIPEEVAHLTRCQEDWGDVQEEKGCTWFTADTPRGFDFNDHWRHMKDETKD
jgi:hypothetical protein